MRSRWSRDRKESYDEVIAIVPAKVKVASNGKLWRRWRKVSRFKECFGRFVTGANGNESREGYWRKERNSRNF